MKLTTTLLVISLFTGIGLSTTVDSANPNPTSGGVFGAGETYTVSVSGIANLLALSGGFYQTNPDGTLAAPIPDTDFWSAQYQYANATNGTEIDMFPGDHADTFAPGIKLGALVYEFGDDTTWHLLEGTLSTGTGGELRLLVADTYYANNQGEYCVTLSGIPGLPGTGVPEPVTSLLIGGGLVAFWGWRKYGRVS